MGGSRYVRVLQLAANGAAVNEETRHTTGDENQATTILDVGRWRGLDDEQVEVSYDGLLLPRHYFVVDGYLAPRMYTRE